MLKSSLRIATIMDDFSNVCFSPESYFIHLKPDCWLSQIVSEKIDLLFVESVWFGLNGLWHGKVSKTSAELSALLDYCKNKRIKTAFWCKEDPVDFHRFILTAQYFDYVFTTDINCISLYKRLLGHRNIFLLPFACQPILHNPIRNSENANREIAACFAGSFYIRYPHRIIDFENIVDSILSVVPLVIYDRYHESADVNYKFPPKYIDYVRGSLPTEQIEVAYKGYVYGINLNTVKKSNSMFARRVFELLASGTVTISNESPGIRYLFGDLVVVGDGGDDLCARLADLSGNMLNLSKLALGGLRKVMLDHTYSHRLNYVLNSTLGLDIQSNLPSVFVIAYARDQVDLERILIMLNSQHSVKWRVAIILNSCAIFDEPIISSYKTCVQLINDEDLYKINFTDLVANAEWVAGMLGSDYYGKNYLIDLVLGTRYSKAKAFGKAAFFDAVSGFPQLLHENISYHATPYVKPRSGLFSFELLGTWSLTQWVNALKDGVDLDVGDQGQALDCFNFCQNAFSVGLSVADVSQLVDDLEIDVGHSMDELYEMANGLDVDIPIWLGKPAWRLQKLAEAFGSSGEGVALHGSLDKFGWHLVSEIPDGLHATIWAENRVLLDELGGVSGLKFHVVEGPGLPVDLLVRFESEGGKLLADMMFETNKNQEWVVPVGATHVRLGFRVFSSGTTRIMRFALTWL